MMSKKSFLTQIIVNFIFAIIFILFAFDSVSQDGWDIWSILCVAFATTDLIRGVKLWQFYRKLKKQ
ncbi:YdiK family protein [Isobaculum melis]|uniref:DUF4305 domain-containing protein n=1 Tax=Isobaculum melis TaxID=142588 RepID=A0A1H9TGT2_9LACT|nr:YdiK family protein [Isobaculum melis]SER96338.1 protein of unknown function [Isobaculum melis]